MPRSHSPFPDPACRLSDEYPMLAAVLADTRYPPDDLPKLVYADWLEERADPRGPFLREWVTAMQADRPRPVAPKGMSACWLSVIGYTLEAAVHRLGYPVWSDAVLRAARPGVLVSTKPHTGKPFPTGASKVGGLPDLPPDAEWPEGETGPAAFVAQWNLEELAASPVCRPLPKTGLLSFFIDLLPFVEDSGDGITKVVYTPTLNGLEEREPDNERAEENVLRECQVEFFEWLTLPDTSSHTLSRSRLPAGALEEYDHCYWAWPSPPFRHQLFGFPVPIQSDPTPSPPAEWTLLTQLRGDVNAGLEACDGGAWYFMIHTDDLKEANFKDVLTEFQTG
jgi:uncharacterized protein (TIGR02996 family)